MASQKHPPPADGVPEGDGRSEPGILCWNCRNLTPFPAEECARCGAAFAGSHGGAYGDQVPVRTVRAPVSSPAGAVFAMAKEIPPIPDVPGAGRTGGSRAGNLPPPSRPMKVSVPVECPVCGRPSASGAGQCQCGVVFGDAATTFNCAECGSLLPIEADHCFICGIGLERTDAMYTCPLCGAVVTEAATSCRCGAQFAD